MIRYLTAGESHGKGLTIIIDGIPSNLKISENDINITLSARQKGYGRGARQKIETDKVEILSGIRFGKTTGAPVSVLIKNKDYANWVDMMDPVKKGKKVVELNVPRPGHADLPGGIKFNHHDYRNVLERASARETAARVVVGAICKKMLSEFDVDVFGYVSAIGGIATTKDNSMNIKAVKAAVKTADKIVKADLRCPDTVKAKAMINGIKEAIRKKDTLGGIIKVMTSKLPVGLGDYSQWDKKLDANIAAALMSLQAIKGVEFGAGFAYADNLGSKMHDEIYYTKSKGFYRNTNNAGGVEGGMSNGEALVVSAVLKPISTIGKGLSSVNVKTKQKVKTIYERSDICAVSAASLIAETIVATEIAKFMQVKFGGDEINLMKSNYRNYLNYLKKY